MSNGAEPASPLAQLSKAISDVRDAKTVKKRKENELALAKESVKKCRNACDQADDNAQDAERRLEQMCNTYSQYSKEREELEKLLDLTGHGVLDSPLASTEQSPDVQSEMSWYSAAAGETSFFSNPLATATAKSAPLPKGSVGIAVSVKKWS